MAIVTTGSIIAGLVPGLRESIQCSGVAVPQVYYVVGNPSNKVTAIGGSDIAIDAVNGKFYMAKTTNGSTWFNLGSRA